jgi:hypothetical protein
LREPRLQQRGTRAFQRGRGGHAHPGLLQAQLHRGPVPVQRHHPQCGLHHGTDGGGGRQLREEHRYAGYIHLKTIPEASPELLASAGRYADRLSTSWNCPPKPAERLAPEKTVHSIRGAMGELRWRIEEAKEARKAPQRWHRRPAAALARASPFRTGRQSTR